MKRLTAGLLAFLALAGLSNLSHAAADPVTVETKWVQKTFSISTTGVTSTSFDIGGFAAYGYAILGTTYTANGVDGTTLGAVLTVDTNTVNVVGLSYSALPLGGSASLKIAQTVKTPPPHAPFGFGVQSSTVITAGNSPFPGAYNFVAPVISTSAAIVIPNSSPWSDTFQAQTSNPIFYFTGLTSGATLFFTVDYAVPRPQ